MPDVFGEDSSSQWAPVYNNIVLSSLSRHISLLDFIRENFNLIGC